MSAVLARPAALMGGPGGPKSCAGSVTAAGSLLFSLDVEEDARSNDADTALARLEQRLAQVAGLCRFAQQHGEELQLVFDVQRVMAALRSESGDGSLDAKAMAARLGAMGYRVTVRNALGGGPACFRNLRHEFLTVLSGSSSSGNGAPAAAPATAAAAAAAAVAAGGVLHNASSSALAAGAGGPEYIVDPFFKQQFEVSQPSSAYAAVLALVPAAYVGPLARLVPLVHALCAEMAASFEVMGLTLPPWRRAGAMLSKWQPSRCRDVCVTGGEAGDCGGSDLGSDGGGGGSTGSSPTGLDAAAAGGSPFSRVAIDHQLSRQCSGRSLLSGKLLTHNGPAASSSTSSMRSSLSRAMSSCSGQSAGAIHSAAEAAVAAAAAAATAAAPPGSSSGLQAMQLVHQAPAAAAQQQPARAAQAAGTVSRQPPVYRGLPATYTVKMGGALAPPAAAGHPPGGQPLLH